MANYGRLWSAPQRREWHRSLARGVIRTRCTGSGCRHWPGAVANRSRRRDLKEIAVNHCFAEIASTFGSIRSFDDIVTGVASVAFCACSAVLFAVVFAAAI
jgi:hypothetical protein